MNLSRRGFIAGLSGTIVCAPAIVRAASLMPVKEIVYSAPNLAFVAEPLSFDIDKIVVSGRTRWFKSEFNLTNKEIQSLLNDPVLKTYYEKINKGLKLGQMQYIRETTQVLGEGRISL